MVDYVRDPTPHDNFGGRNLRGWSAWACRGLVKSRSFCFFFLSFFLVCFLRHAHRSHFLTDRDDLYVKTRVSGQGCAFWGSNPPENLPKIGPNRHFTAKSTKRQNGHRSPMKVFASVLTDRLTTGGTTQKCKIRSKWVVRGSPDLILEFGDPSVSRER